MSTELTVGALAHCAGAFTFTAGFHTDDWALFTSRAGLKHKYGLWKMCAQTASNSTNSTEDPLQCNAHEFLQITDGNDVCDNDDYDDDGGGDDDDNDNDDGDTDDDNDGADHDDRDGDDDDEDDDDDDNNYDAYLHLARALFIVAGIAAGFGVYYTFCVGCKPDDTERLKKIVYFHTILLAFLVVGGVLFICHADYYDKKHTVNSRFGFSAVLVWVTCGLQTLAALLTSYLLRDKFFKSCKKKCMPTCLKLRENSSSSTRTASETNRGTSTRTSSTADVEVTVTITTLTPASAPAEAPAASTTTATTAASTATTAVAASATASSNTDPELQGAAIVKPPSYCDLFPESDHNTWSDLVTARSRSANSSATNSSCSRPGAIADHTENTGVHQGSDSRSSSRGIFTIIVNPAPDLPPPAEHREQARNLPSPHQYEPYVPPPRYEDIVMNLIPNENNIGDSRPQRRYEETAFDSIPQSRYEETNIDSTPLSSRFRELASTVPPPYEHVIAMDNEASSSPNQTDGCIVIRSRPRDLSPPRPTESNA
ncbi:hypothetical protein ElyMa_002372900 [Elysia marginata]|uniref:Uncharacterized protein n=1 Tax=Elysia marginata TaxID=1093978 RepID=A0AAV4GAN1_9GAST|nr:hypothetical protein ElyMa_002372900 [Elysia marginata]